MSTRGCARTKLRYELIVEELRIHAATPEYALGWAPSVMMYVWRAATTLEAARAASTVLGYAREASPTGRGVLLGIVEERTPPPSPAVRREIAEGLARNGDFLFASALVFEGRGFQASMVRMVATGLSLIARLPFPHHVFERVGDSAQWLERASANEPESVEAARLEALVSRVRCAPMTAVHARTGSG